jgi:protein-tyrosine phosphatase
MMGQSRSVTVAVSYIMQKEGISEKEALERVRQFRPDAKPIDAFLKQLELYHRLECKVDSTHPEVQALGRSTNSIPSQRSSPK